MTSHPQSSVQGFPGRKVVWALAAVWLCLILAAPVLHAQLTTGSISGTVYDASGAVIPNAKIQLQNQDTKDRRELVSNSAGYFTFAAVQPGTYTVTIEDAGFTNWRQTDFVLHPGDIRELSSIRMAAGSQEQTVEVTAAGSQILPTDSGERSAILNAKDIERLSLEGRNLSELLKVLPGVTTVPNGVGNGTGFDFSASASTGSTVGVGLSPSGAPYRGGTSYILDGANIIDPGCNCWSIAVVNPDMTQEVKVQTSNFGADSPNGPVIINTISKNGGATFHGQGYFYARNAALNANSWINNHQNAKRQDAKYYYPGGNVGGPIRIPGTDFNKNNKLFFWFGYEYYYQTLPSASPLQSYVPSAGMRSGNFTSSGDGNAALCGSGFNSSATNWCNNLTGTVAPDGTPITGGVIPSKYLDGGAAALMKMFPAANANPATTPGGYNYYLPISSQQNGYIWRGRIDYNFNDNTKFYIAYQTGNNSGTQPAHIYFNPDNVVLYPGGSISNPTTSRVLTANLVNIITPTLTNEFVFAWGYATSPYKPTDIAASYKSTIGYPYSTVYNSAAKVAPSINSAGAKTFPDLSQPDLWEAGGSYPLSKANPSFSDNLTKVYRSHTIKLGAFTELAGNHQASYVYPNGRLWFNSGLLPNNSYNSSLSANTKIGSNNPVANLVMGIANGQGNNTGNQGFSQDSYMPVQDMAYRTTAFYVMDNWQVRPGLTVNVGLRWDHIGRWYDRQGVGMAVWLPSLYASDVATNQSSAKQVIAFPGVRWHGIDPGIPNSGSPTRLAFTSPRVGLAWDLKGNGSTVIRGGWGEYRWNDQYNDYGGPLGTAQNVTTYNTVGGQAVTLSQISGLKSSGSAAPSGSVTATAYNDYEVPITYAWNLTADHQTPWTTLFEIAYVGNSSHHLLMGGQSDSSGIGGSEFSNVNKVPLGGLFQTDPITGKAASSDPENVSNISDYYPYSGCVVSGSCYGYGTNSVSVKQHIGYSNYNGLQIAWLKQSGRLSFNFNYTWSKSLGIVGSTLDAFNVHGNYGVLNIDRPNVFNASYAYDLGNLYHGNMKLLGGAANGWTISGITTFQSGGNLQAGYTQNLGLTITDTVKNESLTSKTYFGTPSNSILPVITCNPKSGLKSHQLANLSCFSAPTVGTQGVRQITPYLGGPAFKNSDLTVYKTFNITERQNVQFRAAAFNFLNHPLWGLSGTNDVQLKYATADGGHTFTPNVASGLPAGYTWGTMDSKPAGPPIGYRIVEMSLKYSF